MGNRMVGKILNKAKSLLSYADEKIRRPYIVYLICVLIFSLIYNYYLNRWETTTDFVKAIDICPSIFQDFKDYYLGMAQSFLETKRPVGGFIFPAFFAVLLLPLKYLSLQTDMLVWGIFQFTLFMIVIFMFFNKFGKKSPYAAILFFSLMITSVPLLHNFAWGQVSLFLFVGILGVYHLRIAGFPVAAGFLLAFGTSIKYYPAVFIVPFVLRREWRVVVSFLLGVVVFYALVPITVIGFTDWKEFEIASIALLRIKRKLDMIDINSQYFPHVFMRLIVRCAPSLYYSFSFEKLGILGYCIAAVNIGLVWRLRHLKLIVGLSLSIIIVFLTLAFLVRTSWPHYFVYLPFCQVALLVHSLNIFKNHPIKKFTAALAVSVSIILTSIFFFNQFSDWKIYSGYGTIFIANLLLLFPCYMLVLSNEFLRANHHKKED